MMHRRTIAGALVAMLSGSVAARAQGASAEPRVSALIAGALGAMPQLTSPDADGGRAFMGTAVGARLRPVRHVTIDALAAVHFPFPNSDFITGVPEMSGRTRRRFDERIGRVDTFASAEARIGVEGAAGPNGALFRLAAGAGYMSGLAEPFTSVTGGIGSRGRHVRVTAEFERWWFGLPAVAVTYPDTLLPSGQPAPPTTSHYRSRERATHVRLGLEVPLRRPRR